MSAIKAQLIKSLKSEIKAAGLKFSAQNRMKLGPKRSKTGAKVGAADWKSSLRSARRDRTLDSNCRAQPPRELTVQISSPSLPSPVSASELQCVRGSNLCDAVKEPLRML